MTKEEVFEIINFLNSKFEKFTVRVGDTSTIIYYFNTKNSVNCNISINNILLSEYEINPEGLNV